MGRMGRANLLNIQFSLGYCKRYPCATTSTRYNTRMPKMPSQNLLKLLAVLFVVFAVLGWAITSVFSKYNSSKTQTRLETVPAETSEISFEGTITFIDP